MKIIFAVTVFLIFSQSSWAQKFEIGQYIYFDDGGWNQPHKIVSVENGQYYLQDGRSNLQEGPFPESAFAIAQEVPETERWQLGSEVFDQSGKPRRVLAFLSDDNVILRDETFLALFQNRISRNYRVHKEHVYTLREAKEGDRFEANDIVYRPGHTKPATVIGYLEPEGILLEKRTWLGRSTLRWSNPETLQR